MNDHRMMLWLLRVMLALCFALALVFAVALAPVFGADLENEKRSTDRIIDSENVDRVATFVDKVLRGSCPAEVPIQKSKSNELAVNQKTAIQLGITIPESVLLRIDTVLE